MHILRGIFGIAAGACFMGVIGIAGAIECGAALTAALPAGIISAVGVLIFAGLAYLAG